MYTWEMCAIRQKKIGTGTPRVSTHTNTPTATEATTPIPMDVSQMNSHVSKTETDEQESDCCQNEQDQEYDGDEVFAVKAKGKGGFKGACFKCGMRGHKADRCWQKRLGDKKRSIKRIGMVQGNMVTPWSHVGKFLVSFQLARQNVWS